MKTFLKENVLYFALFTAILATAGSLFFSDVLHFIPCVLCWYQRICMYPIIAILIVGILRHDKGVPYYVLPLSTTGMLIAFYQNLLVYNIIPETLAPCRAGVSCTTKYIDWLGFITIPFLSLLTFIV